MRSGSARGRVRAPILRRLGVSIFIDNVSKRIHPRTLKEALSGFGVVADTYIAYWNRRRRNNPITFAFARFSSEGEAIAAVREGNGRMMDGFRVNMFLADQKEKNHVTERSQLENGSSRPRTRVVGARKNGSWRDGRSFKDVLLGAKGGNLKDGIMRAKDGDKKARDGLNGYMNVEEWIRVQVMEKEDFDKENGVSQSASVLH
ncbi:hypothetical protein HRI_002226700 [Hibiscus trionum]|uniref:RRM domain-containing protein n=1 Tax=Hibiscus trionum TaxID=183268 RepID=A0A9W7HWB1_HIBTR|nr:hypothetical protein HRI_002226700 [Hibiscus trionum]